MSFLYLAIYLEIIPPGELSHSFYPYGTQMKFLLYFIQSLLCTSFQCFSVSFSYKHISNPENAHFHFGEVSLYSTLLDVGLLGHKVKCISIFLFDIAKLSPKRVIYTSVSPLEMHESAYFLISSQNTLSHF